MNSQFIDEIEKFIDLNLDKINDQDDEGKTYLMELCKYPNTEHIINKLINNSQCKLQLNLQDNQGRTALMTACRFSETEDLDHIVKLLLTVMTQEELEIRDNKGKTAILIASCYSESVTKILVEAGCCLSVQDNEGSTVLMNAVFSFNTEVVAELISEMSGAELDIQDNDGYTALAFVAYSSNSACNEEMVRLLIDAGCSLNLHTNEKETPLILAVCGCGSLQSSTENTVKMLIDAGCDLDVQDCYGNTALKIAAKRSENILFMLINAGSNLDLPNCNNKTALATAVKNIGEKSTETMVKMLLDAGCNLNIQNNYGCTALMTGITNLRGLCTYKTVQMLIDATVATDESSLNLKDNDGETALMKACCVSRQAVQMLLNSSLNIDVNIPNVYGETCLMMSVFHSNTFYSQNIVELLTSVPSLNVNLQDNDGNTALILACNTVDTTSNIKTVKTLLEAKADINVENNSGSTALTVYYDDNFNNKTLNNTTLNKMISLLLSYKQEYDLTTKELEYLYKKHKELYILIHDLITVKKYVRSVNKGKLIKFIPLRKLQIDSYPDSYKSRMLNCQFDIRSGKLTKEEVFATINPKIKEHFNIRTVDDIIYC